MADWVGQVWDLVADKAKKVDVKLDDDFEQKYSTRSNFILQSNTGAEFGGNSENSALLFSSEDLKIKSGVYLCGTDNSKLEKQNKLAVIVNAYGPLFNEELLYMLIQSFKRELQVKGVMVKGSGSDIWLRISKDALQEGLTLETVGSIAYRRIRDEYSELKQLQILFIVGDNCGFQLAQSIAEKWNTEQEAIKARVWEQRGFNFKDCHVLGHCGKCSDKKLCANVRKMQRIVVKSRNQIQRESE